MGHRNPILWDERKSNIHIKNTYANDQISFLNNYKKKKKAPENSPNSHHLVPELKDVICP